MDIQLPQGMLEVTHRQSHHTGVATLHRLDRLELWMLDRVRARLIEWVAAPDVRINLLVGIGPHGHVGHAQFGDQFSIAHAVDCQSRIDLVNMTAQLLEHAPGFQGVFGFAENDISIHDGSIRTEDDIFGEGVISGGQRLVFCQPQDEIACCFVCLPALIYI